MKWNACNVDFFRFRFSDFVLKRVLPIPWLFWMQNYRFWFRFWHIYPTLTPKYAFQFIFNLATSTQLLKIDKNTAGESSDIEILASSDDENHDGTSTMTTSSGRLSCGRLQSDIWSHFTDSQFPHKLKSTKLKTQVEIVKSAVAVGVCTRSQGVYPPSR